jgi:hypothetical protein
VIAAKSGAPWVSAGFLLALATGSVVLAVFGIQAPGVSLAARSVARVAFAFFWLTYASGALAVMFGSPFDRLARHRREFGLAFAGALLVHLALVIWLFRISAEQPISNVWIVYFVLGALGTYAVAIGSWPRFRGLWGTQAWRILGVIVVEYVAFLFFRDFVLLPLQFGSGHLSPFGLLIMFGMILRWLVGARRWR